MLSKKLLDDLINYCSCYGDDGTPCTYVHCCEFKAECDDVQNTYGCRPFEIPITEKRDTEYEC